MRHGVSAAALLAGLTLGGGLGAADPTPLGSGAPCHTFERAGHSDEVSRWAQPVNSPGFGGYYVGGGCVCRGGPPGPLQGTWGWDYVGTPCWSPRVALGWCYRCRYQAGIGNYKTDGPHVPNVFGLKLSSKSEGHEEHACEPHAEPVGEHPPAH
jgi:hypothetical protein